MCGWWLFRNRGFTRLGERPEPHLELNLAPARGSDGLARFPRVKSMASPNSNSYRCPVLSALLPSFSRHNLKAGGRGAPAYLCGKLRLGKGPATPRVGRVEWGPNWQWNPGRSLKGWDSPGVGGIEVPDNPWSHAGVTVSLILLQSSSASSFLPSLPPLFSFRTPPPSCFSVASWAPGLS